MKTPDNPSNHLSRSKDNSPETQTIGQIRCRPQCCTRLRLGFPPPLALLISPLLRLPVLLVLLVSHLPDTLGAMPLFLLLGPLATPVRRAAGMNVLVEIVPDELGVVVRVAPLAPDVAPAAEAALVCLLLAGAHVPGCPVLDGAKPIYGYHFGGCGGGKAMRIRLEVVTESKTKDIWVLERAM
jgi:hypothetical protein